MNPSNHIGTLQESSLHAALKKIYSNSEDILEANVDSFIVDIFKDNKITEIQTSSFSTIKSKLMKLISKYEVKLVHPIAYEKWILRESPDGSQILGRRKSPKKSSYLDIFNELVFIPRLVNHQNFSIEVVLIREEEVRRNDGKGSWRRRGWSIIDHKLLEIISQRCFANAADFNEFLPGKMTEPFTSSDFAKAVSCPRRLAQKAMYCLRKMGSLKVVGKRRNAFLHEKSLST